jgi:iduronate 2-sulfatase
MRSTLLLLLLASLLAKGTPNVLLICIDDLRPELGCYGVDYIKTPHIDALAAESRIFERHYVQAPTCGASRYALLTGTYGSAGNDALFSRAKGLTKEKPAPSPSMPAWFRQHDYTTVSIGKVSHHPGGRGGSDWDEDGKLELPLSWDRHLMPSGPWQHPRGAMHGLANGQIRGKASEMAVMEAFDGPDTAYPDGLITDTALQELEQLSKGDAPFFLAVGLIRPHLPFGAPTKYLAPYREIPLPPTPHPQKPEGVTTWHGSGEFMKYKRGGRDPRKDAAYAIELRRHYAACVSYADAQVGRLLEKLKELQLNEDTVIVLWGDHGWHLGEHAVWGKHTLFEESLRAPLLIRAPQVEKPGMTTKSVVETIDLFPTLCELTGLETPKTLDGSSLVPILEDPSSPGHPAISYSPRAATLRTDSHRLIAHRNGAIELYDHRTKQKETRNLATTKPDEVTKLLADLKERLPKFKQASKAIRP